ncbi:TonB-dependent receptor [Aestuariicella hydrocarbonica]|uniref:TonB-dependent receptor n=1 Tax=Pseudomaricurvus hydrocarbonicus TaxID=1470433 RepID=A0A9E5JX13_9GAMM|nr:TonB-dependent receptor [Aestuariicella hydrocarbonica]NHO66859.1 TonB-dependent receptor [Aestuariicella hydrocarbonica]
MSVVNLHKQSLSGVIGLLCVAGTSALTFPAFAEGGLSIEEVVVTARKRAESIQDVPLAVSAIAGDDVKNAFTLDTTSLAQFAPNVVMDTIEAGTPSGGGFSIRGISYQDVEKAFDPTVLVAVDGVPLATGTGQVFNLLDIERIEVLRGPQGTLFGKNVVGGLINIHRTKPKLDESSGKIRGRVGEYGKKDLELLYNYGEEDWAVKLTASSLNQDKGFTKNSVSGDLGKKDTTRAGIHWLMALNDSVTLDAQYNYSNMEGYAAAIMPTATDTSDVFCGAYQAYGYVCGGEFGDVVRPAGEKSDRRRSYSDYRGAVGLESHQAIWQVEAELTDSLSLTYIGGWLTADDEYQADMDGIDAVLYHVDRWGDYSQVTHELRFSHDAGGSLLWQAGVFTATADATSNQLSQVFTPVWSPREATETASESHSIFFEGDYSLLDEKLTLTAGTRFITETKRMDRDVYDPATGAYLVGPNAGGERTDNDWIYRWGARYQFADELMVYFTNSTGFRSGGFSPRASTEASLSSGFAPETLTNWEAGIKSTWFDGRLKLNATLFHMVYEDMQIEVSLPAPNVATGNEIAIRNVGEAEFSGVELEFDVLLSEWWRVSGNAGWLDAKYSNFNADIYGDGIVADESNLEIRRAPELTYSLQNVFDWSVGDGLMSWRTSYSWRDGYASTLTNHPGTEIESFGLLDTSLTYELDQWRISLFGRNLTDEDSYTHDYAVSPNRPTAGTENPGSLWKFATVRSPREWGLEVTYTF